MQLEKIAFSRWGASQYSAKKYISKKINQQKNIQKKKVGVKSSLSKDRFQIKKQFTHQY